MDPRVRDHAATLVDWSARIEPGDDVVVQVDDGAHDLAVAVAEALGEREANLLATNDSDELSRAYLRAHDGDFETDPDFALELYRRADSVLSLRGSTNVAASADVPGDRRQAYARAREGIREARLDTKWMSTLHPTRAHAQAAGMAYEPYRDFVYGSVLRDWPSLADEMARLVDLFDEATEVRIQKETDDTDISLDVDGRTAINSAASVAYDSHNLPSGEVFTAPAGAEGTVHFDLPVTIQDQRVRDVTLEFDSGVVVDWEAALGADTIRDVLDTDDGARRLGELGVGMNRGIDRPTDSILFDEKMAGTVHLALGRAYAACLPGDEQGNRSAIHADLITDMSHPESELLIDGKLVQRDGRFRWEDGFAGA